MPGLAIDFLEDGFGTLPQQVFGHRHPQRLGIGTRRTGLGHQQQAAARLADQTA
ncbi:hypothetical protein D3C71_1628020 [compost metagenome]